MVFIPMNLWEQVRTYLTLQLSCLLLHLCDPVNARCLLVFLKHCQHELLSSSTQLTFCSVWSAVSKASECLLSRYLCAVLNYNHFAHFASIDHNGKPLTITAAQAHKHTSTRIKTISLKLADTAAADAAAADTTAADTATAYTAAADTAAADAAAADTTADSNR